MFSNTPLPIILSNISTLLPFLAGTALICRRRHRTFIVLWIFFAVATITEVFVHIYSLQGEPNAWISHIYTPIEYGLLAYIISILQQKPSVRRVIRLSIPIYVCMFLVLKVTGVENFDADTMNYLSRPVSLLLLSGFGFYTLHKVCMNLAGSLSNDFRFWILLAIATYASGSVIINSFLYIKTHEILLHLIYSHAVLNILHNALFTVGIVLAFVSHSTESPSEEKEKDHA